MAPHYLRLKPSILLTLLKSIWRDGKIIGTVILSGMDGMKQEARSLHSPFITKAVIATIKNKQGYREQK